MLNSKKNNRPATEEQVAAKNTIISPTISVTPKGNKSL